MRPTLADVARAAGVSTATVDRVLNGRAGVRARTREVVTEAARRLGYVGDEPVPQPNGRVLSFDVILPAGTNSYIEDLRQQFIAQGAAARLAGDDPKHGGAAIEVVAGEPPPEVAAAQDQDRRIAALDRFVFAAHRIPSRTDWVEGRS